MALPDAENLAYRGITSGNAQCIAYRGFICGIIIISWRDIKELTLTIKKLILFNVER